jgi:hypothetical protein
MPATTVVGGMCSLSFGQLAVAACQCWRCVPLLRTVFAQVAIPTPQARGRLFAISPDMAKLLAVVALHECVLWFALLYLDGTVAEAGEYEDILDCCHSREDHKEQRQCNACSFRRLTSGWHLSDANNVNLRSTTPSAMSSACFLEG